MVSHHVNIFRQVFFHPPPVAPRLGAMEDQHPPSRVQRYPNLWFGNELRRLIDAKPHASLRNVGDHTGMSHSTVRGWLHGEFLPSDPATIAQLARYLDADADVLQTLKECDETDFKMLRAPLEETQRKMVAEATREKAEAALRKRGEVAVAG